MKQERGLQRNRQYVQEQIDVMGKKEKGKDDVGRRWRKTDNVRIQIAIGEKDQCDVRLQGGICLKPVWHQGERQAAVERRDREEAGGPPSPSSLPH